MAAPPWYLSLGGTSELWPLVDRCWVERVCKDGTSPRSCQFRGRSAHCGLERHAIKDVWRYVPVGSTALELGARYGTVSCALSKRQNYSGLRVSVEPDPSAFAAMDTNARAHGCDGLNARGLVGQAAMCNTRKGYANRAVPCSPSAAAVPTFSVSSLARQLSTRVGRQVFFDTVVIDCENCTRALLRDERAFFEDPRLTTILYEADERSPELIRTICSLGFGIVSNQLDCLYPGWDLAQLVFKRGTDLPCPIKAEGDPDGLRAACTEPMRPALHPTARVLTDKPTSNPGLGIELSKFLRFGAAVGPSAGHEEASGGRAISDSTRNAGQAADEPLRSPRIGLVISEGGDNSHRFSRARSILESVGFTAVIQLPPTFVAPTSTCRGVNGLRQAARNAYRLIASSNVTMGVFEDDIKLADAAAAVRQKLDNFIGRTRAGLGFLGACGGNGFHCTHAIWIRPDAARLLLDKTADCFRIPGEGLDTHVIAHDICENRCNCTSITCETAGPEYHARKGPRLRFVGLFHQDRDTIPSYLHATGRAGKALWPYAGGGPAQIMQAPPAQELTAPPALWMSKTAPDALCPATIHLCKQLVVDLSNKSFFKEVFPASQYALFWHELSPSGRRWPRQNDAFFKPLAHAWARNGLFGFWDNRSPLKHLANRRCGGVGADAYINFSYVVAWAARVLNPSVFLLAVNVTRARLAEYNQLSPLSYHQELDPPFVRVFCSVERPALGATPVHVIDSFELYEACRQEGMHACLRRMTHHQGLSVEDVCGQSASLSAARCSPSHPENVCAGCRSSGAPKLPARMEQTRVHGCECEWALTCGGRAHCRRWSLRPTSGTRCTQICCSALSTVRNGSIAARGAAEWKSGLKPGQPALRRPDAVGCAPNTSVAVFLAGSKWVAGVLCLRASLRSVGSACPVDLLYDDRPSAPALSPQVLQELSVSFGEDRLISLNDLVRQHEAARSAIRPAGMPPTLGRRLFSRREVSSTHAKLWLWALPRERVVVMDADMAVLSKPDWLTHVVLGESDVLAAKAMGNSNTFNSGLMVIRPSAANLDHLESFAGRAWTLQRVRDRVVGDQTILNHAFAGRWRNLPELRVGTAHVHIGVGRFDENAALHSDLIHWIGEPKPWVWGPGTNFSQHALWWRLCKAAVGSTWRWAGKLD